MAGTRSISADVQTRAFATQYTAIILIILTFVIGAYANNPHDEVKRTEPPPAVEKPLKEQFISDTVIESPFLSGSSRINIKSFYPFLEILKSHDLGIEIEVGEVDETFSAQRQIVNYFRGQGLPPQTIKVSSVRSTEAGVRFKLFHLSSP